MRRRIETMARRDCFPGGLSHLSHPFPFVAKSSL